jgi:type I restriction enzyme S subunit
LQGVFEKKGEGWEEKKFVDLCDLITCGVAATPKYVDESVGIPFLSAQNVRNGEVVLDKYRFISTEFHKELTKKNKPKKGDILYSRVGAKYGEAGVVEHDFEFSVYVSLTLIKPKPDKLDNYFLKYLLNSPSIKELAKKSISSSGVPNLNVKEVREFLIPHPSISIQKQIVNDIEKVQAETQKLEAIYQQKLNDLEELKKSVLQKAFSGQLSASGFTGLKDEQDLNAKKILKS